MSRRLRLLSIAAAAALALGFAAPADAASIMMCRPPAPGTGSSGPGRITMQGTSNVYQLDRWGCAAFLATDVGEATANGFTQTGAVRALVLSGATAQAKVGDLPPAAYILGVAVENESATAISAVNNAGIKIGTTAGGTDIVNNMAVTSWNRGTATDVSISKRAFSATQATAVWVDMASWTGVTVVVTVLYTFF